MHIVMHGIILGACGYQNATFAPVVRPTSAMQSQTAGVLRIRDAHIL